MVEDFGKKFVKYLVIIALISAIAAGVLAGRGLIAQETHGSHPEHAQGRDPTQESVEVWTCSMHPQIRLPNPGKCPICGMDLIPLQEETGGRGGSEGLSSMRELRLSPYAEELAEIEVQPIERKFVQAEIPMVGKVEYDETRVATIAAWVPGRIDRLHVNFTGTTVRKGDPMVSLYSPELLTAQQELLQSLRASRELKRSRLDIVKDATEGTVTAAREKLRLWGLTSRQIDDIVKRGKPEDHITIFAPISGVVIHKNALEGQYVKTGSPIYTIGDLSRVWVKLDAYESDIQWVREGQEVEVRAEAYPGDVFKGSVAFIDPFLDEKTRTVKVRIDVPNRGGKLKPEMFVHAVLRAGLSNEGEVITGSTAGREAPLVIPASAPLITGKRAVVYVAVPGEPGRYVGREIVLGPRAGDYYLVEHGLKEGESVVTRGNFKIDSAVQIHARPSMMSPEGGSAGGGHQHDQGGGSPAGAPTTSSTQGRAGLDVPESFKEQLRSIMAAYEETRDVVDTRELARIQEGFASFRETLQQVDMSGLSGHPRMVWLEYVMLLENDAVIGQDARKLSGAERAFRTLSGHIEGMQRQFALDAGGAGDGVYAVDVQGPAVDHTDHAAKAAPSIPVDQVPEAFRAEMGKLLDAYLIAADALARDRFEEALQGMKTLEAAVGSVDMSLLQGDAHAVWMDFFSRLRQALAQLGQAEDLAALRRCFALVSEATALAVETFGIHPQQPVYLVHCSMAFDGQGANWLQKDKEIRNPYYGAAMLRCGEVVRTFFADSST